MEKTASCYFCGKKDRKENMEGRFRTAGWRDYAHVDDGFVFTHQSCITERSEFWKTILILSLFMYFFVALLDQFGIQLIISKYYVVLVLGTSGVASALWFIFRYPTRIASREVRKNLPPIVRRSSR